MLAPQNNAKPLPPQSELAALLAYNPNTGDLIWRPRAGDSRWQKLYAYRLAFREVKSGRYFAGCVKHQKFLSHRVIWKLVTGRDPLNIDHINRNGFDNRWENLREVTHRENCNNRSRNGRQAT